MGVPVATNGIAGCGFLLRLWMRFLTATMVLSILDMTAIGILVETYTSVLHGIIYLVLRMKML